MWHTIDNSGNYTCSQELAAEFLAESYADTEPSAPSRSKSTREKSCCNDSVTESCQGSLYGTMYRPSTGSLGGGGLTPSRPDSHANRSALPESKLPNQTPGTCGQIQQELFPKSCHNTSCSKMCQEYANTCPWSCVTCGELATPLDDQELLPPPPWVQDIYAGASGYMPTLTKRDSRTLKGSQPPKRAKTSGEPLAWKIAKQHLPTLTKCGNYNRKGASKSSGDGLATVVGGRLNPTWCEWYTGVPMGWTALAALEISKFQQWKDAHGIYSALTNDENEEVENDGE